MISQQGNEIVTGANLFRDKAIGGGETGLVDSNGTEKKEANMLQANHPWLNRRHLVVLAFQLITGVAIAQPYSGSVMSATGGAGRASVEAGDAPFLNPSIIAHLRGRNLQSSFAHDEWSIGMTENVSDSPVPAALAYAQKTHRPELPGDIVEQDLRLSLADFVRKHVALGVSLHQYIVNTRENSYRQVNGDVGLTINPRENWGMGLVVYDLVATDPLDVPVVYRLRTKTGWGLSWLPRESLRLRADVLSAGGNNFGRPNAMLGLESTYNQFIMVRVGYQNDHDLSQEIFATGFGFNLGKFHVNYAYQTSIKGDFGIRHSVDLGIPF